MKTTYCAIVEGIYQMFFDEEFSVRFCVEKDTPIVKVKVERDEENGTHWAWLDFETNNLEFIFQTKIQLELCSGDFFKDDIKNGRGEIVKVSITEIGENKND